MFLMVRSCALIPFYIQLSSNSIDPKLKIRDANLHEKSAIKVVIDWLSIS